MVGWSVGAGGNTINGGAGSGIAGADKVDKYHRDIYGVLPPVRLIALTKVGSGTMTMSGINGYTGATSVNGGTLLVTGSLANTAVAVGNGTLSGALGGSGTIAGPVTVSSTGHLSPAIGPLRVPARSPRIGQ